MIHLNILIFSNIHMFGSCLEELQEELKEELSHLVAPTNKLTVNLRRIKD